MRWFRRITFHRSDATPKWHIVEGVEHRTLVAKCGYRYDKILLDSLVKIAAWTVEHSTPDDDIEAVIDAVHRIAIEAGKIDPETRGCDGCDSTYSVSVIDAVDMILPLWSVAYDTDGTVDVAICPFCVHTTENEPMPEPDPVTDAEWTELQRQIDEDEASAREDYP